MLDAVLFTRDSEDKAGTHIVFVASISLKGPPSSRD
jgi:hypothetical protein